MKRLWCLFIATVLLVSFPMAVSAETEYTEGDFKYTVWQEKATITEYIGTASEVEVPSTLGGYQVTKIGDYLFGTNTVYDRISFPATLTDIAQSAISECSIKRFDVTDLAAWCGVSLQGSYFYPLWGGADLYLNGQKVTELVIPEGVTQLKMSFGGCGSIEKVVFPEGMTILDQSDAFAHCPSLTTVSFPDNFEHIGDSAFYKCSKLSEVTLPSKLRIIGGEAFAHCTSLTEIHLPANMTRIEHYAFANCTALQYLTLPTSIEETYYNKAFSGCTALEKVNIPGGLGTVYGGMFSECTALKEVEIGEGITAIGNGAFSGCASLTEITLPESISKIDTGAFAGCSALETVRFPALLDALGASAFLGCTSLQKIKLPSGITKVERSTFEGCTALEEVILPQSVRSMEERAFYDCPNLQEIYLHRGISINKSNIFTVMGEDLIPLPRTLTIYGHSGSAAEEYAEENGYDFVDVDMLCLNGHLRSGKLVTRPATCGEDGLGYIQCLQCKMVLHDNLVIDRTGSHDYDSGLVTRLPTQTEYGIRLHTCTVCGATKNEYIAKLPAEKPPAPPRTAVDIFKDIKKGDWFVKNGAIDYAYNNGFFKGVTDTTFEPDTSVTRGMFVTVLGRLHGVKEKKAKTQFADVKKSAYYSGFVAWAAKAGVVTGATPTAFEPEKSVTREQICAMMYRYCDYADIKLQKLQKAVTFADAREISSYAKKAVDACQRGAIVSGKGGGKFDPQGNATRAEVATILMNFCKNYK